MTRTVYELARSQVLVVLTRSVNVAGGIVTPLMLMSLLVLPRLDRLSPAQATAVFSGVLLASLWGASLWSGAGILRRERWFGTLAPSFTGRPGPVTVLLGKTLGGVVYDVSLILMSSTLFVLGTGLHLQISHPWAFGAGLVTVVGSGVASSLLIGAVLMLSRHAFQLTTAFGTPMLLLGGTVLPYDHLPGWVQVVGVAVNLSWLQRFLASTADRPDWAALAIGALLSAGYALTGALLVSVMLRRAREDGSLELA